MTKDIINHKWSKWADEQKSCKRCGLLAEGGTQTWPSGYVAADGQRFGSREMPNCIDPFEERR